MLFTAQMQLREIGTNIEEPFLFVILVIDPNFIFAERNWRIFSSYILKLL